MTISNTGKEWKFRPQAPSTCAFVSWCHMTLEFIFTTKQKVQIKSSFLLVKNCVRFTVVPREYLNSKSELERVRDRKLIRIVHGEVKHFSLFTMIAHRNHKRIVQFNYRVTITTHLSAQYKWGKICCHPKYWNTRGTFVECGYLLKGATPYLCTKSKAKRSKVNQSQLN